MSKQNKTAAILETLHDIRSYEVVDGVQPIPKLAAIDRKSIGWIRIVLFSLLRFAWAFFVFLFLLAILFLWLNFSVQLIHQFLAARFPGKETQTLILMVLLSGWIIYRAEGWRTILADYSLWPKDNLEEKPFTLLLTVYKRIVQLMMAVFIDSFLLYSLLPYIVVVLTIFERVQAVFANWDESRAYMQSFWQPGMVIILITFILIFLLRKNPREKLLGQNLKITGLFGLIFIVESFVFRLEPSWLYLSEIWPFTQWNEIAASDPSTIWQVSYLLIAFIAAWLWEIFASLVNGSWIISSAVFIVLALVYPMGAVLFLSRVFRRPYPAFYGALLWTVLRVKLRWKAWKALIRHRKRNQEQIEGDGWATVCQDHLVRFISSTERLSYMRRFVYYHCPQCMQDNKVYTGVECIAMQLDTSMNGHCYQNGPTLYLNGLQWANQNQGRQRPILDVLVIGKTKKLDIDEFVTMYMNKEPRKYSRELKQVTGQVLSGNELEPNERRNLEDHLAQLTFNFDPKVTPNACSRNIRLRDTLSRGNHQFQAASKKSLRLIIILAIIAAILLAIYFFMLLPALN